MADKWKDVGSDVSLGNLMNAVFGADTRVVKNETTGEYRKVTIGLVSGPKTVGEAIAKGKFDDKK